MLYIIGLGNYGEKYTYTRHNVAWIILDTLFSGGWNHHKYMNAEIYIGNDRLYIKPQTFMNHSGEVISFLKKEINFNPEDIVVMYDDIDLVFGDIRISYDRGDGGHNGMKSIINHMGSKKSVRIRIGISRKLEDGHLVKPNVLEKFTPEEQIIIRNELTQKVVRIIQSLAQEGKEKTMNVYNTK